MDALFLLKDFDRRRLIVFSMAIHRADNNLHRSVLTNILVAIKLDARASSP